MSAAALNSSNMINVKVKIKFRDDKIKEYECYDTPYASSSWVTLYLRGKNSMERLMLPMEGIAEINYYYYEAKNR